MILRRACLLRRTGSDGRLHGGCQGSCLPVQRRVAGQGGGLPLQHIVCKARKGVDYRLPQLKRNCRTLGRVVGRRVPRAQIPRQDPPQFCATAGLPSSARQH